MNQHQFVTWAQKQHQFVDETFEDAHYPLPRNMGDETIKLHHYDHQIQGIFQSEEVGRKCFYENDVIKALNKPNYFPLGWFEAWDLYEKWVGILRSEAGKKSAESHKKSGHFDKIRPLAVEARKVRVILTHLETNMEFEFESQAAAAKHFGLNGGNLRMTEKGIRKSHKGFVMRRKS